jgi:hypothetical protein
MSHTIQQPKFAVAGFDGCSVSFVEKRGRSDPDSDVRLMATLGWCEFTDGGGERLERASLQKHRPCPHFQRVGVPMSASGKAG